MLFENSFLNSLLEVYSKGNCDMCELKVEKLIPVQKVAPPPPFDLDWLQWSEDSSATPPKLNPLESFGSFLTQPFLFSFFSCSFILKTNGSRYVIFAPFRPDPNHIIISYTNTTK